MPTAHADNPLPELREVREQIERCRALMAKRDELVKESAGRYSQRRIAQAAGVSRTRVNQIVSS